MSFFFTRVWTTFTQLIEPIYWKATWVKYQQRFKETGVQAEVFRNKLSGITFIASWAIYSTFKPFFKVSSDYSFPYWEKGAFPSGKRIGTVGLPVSPLLQHSQSKIGKKDKSTPEARIGFPPFIETQLKSSVALEPLQDWARPCLPLNA